MNQYRYLESLEDELALLENQAARANSTTSARRIASVSGVSPAKDGPSFDWTSIGEGDSNRLHPTFAYGLDHMFRSAVAVDNGFPYHSRQRNLLFPGAWRDRASGSSQSHPFASTYLQTFLDSVQRCLPVFSDADLLRFKAADGSDEHPVGDPTFEMALAIGAVLTPGNEAISSYHALEFFGAALRQANPASLDVQTLQLFILVTIFSLFHSAAGSTWHLLGLATQVAVALGLHHKQGAQLPDHRHRQNLFWIVYVLDR